MVVVLWHASGAEGSEAVVLVPHRSVRVVAALSKLTVPPAQCAERNGRIEQYVLMEARTGDAFEAAPVT
jgi:hypothetical protein